MDRATYDRLRELVATSYSNPDGQLATLGIAPDEWPRTEEHAELSEIFGAELDHSPISSICAEFGWSDPGVIDYVAVTPYAGPWETISRIVAVVQEHTDNTPTVSVYVMDRKDGRQWTLDVDITAS